VIPLPFTWPALIPFWVAFYWTFIAELPFIRRDRVTAAARSDRWSMRVILFAGSVAMFLAFLFAAALREFSVVAGRIPLSVTGIAVIVAAGWLRRHCFRMLGASFTYDVRVQAGQPVVERGAYRFVRHPSYTAGMLLFGGIGAALTNWLSLGISIALPVFAYAYRIRVEEHALVSTLGPPYVEYMQRTRRLVPFLI
jgi:protein-S-isoprenylcysteine O-methyltransferase Ste14